jgi:hypothetical protein
MARYVCHHCYKEFLADCPQIIGRTPSCIYCGSPETSLAKRKKEEPSYNFSSTPVRVFNPAVSFEAYVYNPYTSIKYNTKVSRVLLTIGDAGTGGIQYKELVRQLCHLSYGSQHVRPGDSAYWKDYTTKDYNTQYFDAVLRKLELTGLIKRKKRGLYVITDKGERAIEEFLSCDKWYL